MHGSEQDPSYPGTTEHDDQEQSPERIIRDDGTGPSQGDVNPTPPQRGYNGPEADRQRGVVRGDPSSPSQGDVNPTPPARGWDQDERQRGHH